MNINDFSPIKQRFYMIFKSTGLTQAEFGKSLGKSQKLISAILNNRSNISGDMIQLLFYKFKVNPNYLLKGEKPMFIEKMDINRRIPIIADIPAGDWRHWFDSYAAGAGDDYIAVPNLKGNNLFAIRVVGDSMEPLLFKGDILILDPQKQYRNGLAVVRHDWGYKIRNVYRRGKNTYYLCPQNSKHESKEIVANNETKVYIPVKVISMKDL